MEDEKDNKYGTKTFTTQSVDVKQDLLVQKVVYVKLVGTEELDDEKSAAYEMFWAAM